MKKEKIKILIFWVVLGAISILALCVPLRPTFSKMEKRDLAEFPKFSFSNLSNGEYFRGIDLWFSDSFPFKDTLSNLNRKITNSHGIQAMEVQGNISNGDDIPEPPTWN